MYCFIFRWAFGVGDWSGDFDSININIAIFTASVFRSSGETDGNGWVGFTFGIGPGMPGGAVEWTTYRESPTQPMRDLGY